MKTATIQIPEGLSQLQGDQVPPAEVKAHYCLYARKSSEDDERQALSIDSQIKEMMLIANREGLEVVEVRRESHSAQNSGKRPEFNRLIKDIRIGTFNGILTWAPDRLSRNAGDLGTIVDLMDQGLLHDIRTHGQRFRNSPNEKFLLMILCSQAKLENDNRGINVKRGLKNKCELGVRPGVAPLGYLNKRSPDRNKGKIIIDPERAPVIKEMFTLVAHKHYSGRRIKKWLDTEVDFTTRTGKRITLSTIYRAFKSTFYYGKFEYPSGSGNWYDGTHEPIISKSLFDEAQKQLEVAPKNWGAKEFEFIRMFTCGACGSGITAEEKFKYRKDGTASRYVYYHCTCGRNRDCKQPYVREEDILVQLVSLMDKVSIKKLGMRDRIEKDIERYERFTTSVLGRKETGAKKQVPRVNIRKYAKYVLQEGAKEDKRELLKHLKSELMLKDKKVYLRQKEPSQKSE